jgi:hypothetical protein
MVADRERESRHPKFDSIGMIPFLRAAESWGLRS